LSRPEPGRSVRRQGAPSFGLRIAQGRERGKRRIRVERLFAARTVLEGTLLPRLALEGLATAAVGPAVVATGAAILVFGARCPGLATLAVVPTGPVVPLALFLLLDRGGRAVGLLGPTVRPAVPGIVRATAAGEPDLVELGLGRP